MIQKKIFEIIYSKFDETLIFSNVLLTNNRDKNFPKLNISRISEDYSWKYHSHKSNYINNSTSSTAIELEYKILPHRLKLHTIPVFLFIILKTRVCVVPNIAIPYEVVFHRHTTYIYDYLSDWWRKKLYK